MNKIISLSWIVIFTLVLYDSAPSQQYAVANDFCPVLNIADFDKVFGGEDGRTLKLNENKFIEELEFIAYPGSAFEIKNEIKKKGYSIFEVVTNEYPYDKSKLYIDSRFTDQYDVMPFDRMPEPFSTEQILERLNSLEGTPYLWGGNCSKGVPKMTEYYRPPEDADAHTKSIWELRGVDCSGLLYEATGGATPRNTSSLVNWGDPVDIEGMTWEIILEKTEPLDLIAWDGHVLIVVNGGYVIESSPTIGVNRTRLDGTLEKITEERKPVNYWDGSEGDRFVIRRWINSMQ